MKQYVFFTVLLLLMCSACKSTPSAGWNNEPNGDRTSQMAMAPLTWTGITTTHTTDFGDSIVFVKDDVMKVRPVTWTEGEAIRADPDTGQYQISTTWSSAQYGYYDKDGQISQKMEIFRLDPAEGTYRGVKIDKDEDGYVLSFTVPVDGLILDEKTPGVEAIQRMSRYSTFVGIGRAFDAATVLHQLIDTAR